MLDMTLRSLIATSKVKVKVKMDFSLVYHITSCYQTLLSLRFKQLLSSC